MAKNRKSKRPHSKKSGAAGEGAAQPARRNFMRLARNAAIALPVLGGVGFFSVRSVQATICEADLTKVGKGLPTIVQIHDPSCQLCTTLQKQTRRALKEYDPDGHTFLVANIQTAEGGAFARQHGVPHVTLLLFDARGEMKQVVRGPIASHQLEPILAAHMERYGTRG
jgi:hypothetical protein